MHPCDACGNIDPVDHEPYKTCESTSCRECKLLDDLSGRIMKTKAHLDFLLNTHRQLKPRLNRIHKSIVDRLPVELISSIFILCTGDILGSEKDDDLTSPLVLGAVCRSWRRVAWSTPSLWTALRFILKSRTTEEHVELATEWLQRSKALPLSIELKAANPFIPLHMQYRLLRPLGIYLSKNSYRWYTLILDLPTPVINILSDAEHGSPLLHELDLGMNSNGSLEITQASPKIVRAGYMFHRDLKLQWNNLLFVSASAFNTLEAVQVMQSAPQLMGCFFSMKDRAFVQPTLPSVQSPVTLAELTSLEVHFNLDHDPCRSIRYFFDSVACPALTDCIIGFGSHEAPMESILPFFGRSGHRLAELAISGASPSGSNLVDIAKLTPSLEELMLTLEITEINRGTFNAFYTALSGHLYGVVNPLTGEPEPAAPILPNLQDFKIWGDLGSFPAQLIEGLFTPFVRPNSASPRPLDSVSISLFPNHSNARIDDDTLDKILNLQEGGVEFEIRNWLGSEFEDLIEKALQKAEDNAPGEEGEEDQPDPDDDLSGSDDDTAFASSQ